MLRRVYEFHEIGDVLRSKTMMSNVLRSKTMVADAMSDLIVTMAIYYMYKYVCISVLSPRQM
jgi:hypothetical protein